MDTSKPENWLSALKILTNSPQLSRKVLSSPDNGNFRGRLSCIHSDGLNVLGTCLHNSSLISGVNAGSATIVMPVEGTVEFQVMGGNCLCGPWTPFLLEADELFHASLSEQTHLLIVQLPDLEESGYRATFRRHQLLVADMLTDFLYETPFFHNYRHAKKRVGDLSRQFRELFENGYSASEGLNRRKQVRDERRLCKAIQLLNEELHTDINLESIAGRSALSLRNFHYLMKQYIGQSPYQYLRGRRLIKARQAIIQDYPKNISIAQQALNSGFQHAGRFSAYYLQHFGEYPNETLSNLNRLKQLTDQVKSIGQETGNISPYWLTSSATS